MNPMMHRTTEPREPRAASATARIALLVSLVGAAAHAPCATARQAEQAQPTQEPAPQTPPPASPPAEEKAQEQQGGLRKLWGSFRGSAPAPAQPAVQNPPPASPTAQPGDGAAPGTPSGPGAAPGAPPAPIAEGKPGEFVQFPVFAEDVDLFALTEWAANYLDVNIFIDPQLANHTVRFTGPMQIKHEDLIDLLSYLLEQQGFGLTQEREGWYSVRPVGDVSVRPGQDEFATTRVIFTPMVKPSAIQGAVTAAISRAGAGQVGAGSKALFSDELGAIIITDTPRTIRQIEEIVGVIVKEFAGLGLHRFPVTYLSADVARSRAIQLTGGGSTASGAPSAPAAPNPNQQIGAATPLGAAGGLSNLSTRLYLDGSSNALVFRGSDTEAAALANLLAVIDVPSRLVGKRYPVGPAASQIAQIGQTQGLGTIVQSAGEFGATGSTGFSASPQAALPQQGQNAEGPHFLLEDGAFVYFGTEEQHQEVRKLVDTYADQSRQARIVVELYKLKHADAEDVAEILNALLQEQQAGSSTPFLPRSTDAFGRTSRSRNRAAASQAEGERERSERASADLGQRSSTPASATGSGASAGEMTLTPMEDVSIHADVARNQVIVKAPVRQQEQIAAILAKLDVRRPQVYLEAKILVVSSTDNFQFAVETQFTPGQAVLFTNFGLTTAGTAVAPGQAAEARRNVATGLGGLTAAIIKSEYVPIVINALQRVGETRILSNPQLLVNDNEEAELISVREEPYAVSVQGTSTTQTSQGGVAEAGTKLTVTPQISDAGLLNLEYAIELSRFEASSGTTGLQPPKQKENYKSVVTLPSDATMVIGGLTTQNLRKSVSKVPLLGDIPLIGELFRSTTKDTTNSTIYVFIRPVIMRESNFGDLRLLTKGPADKVDLAPDTPDLEPARIPIASGGLGLPPARGREDYDLRPVRPGDE